MTTTNQTIGYISRNKHGRGLFADRPSEIEGGPPKWWEPVKLATCLRLKIKKLHPEAAVPQYATPGAACFDLVALDDGTPHPKDPQALIYRTGLAFEVPNGWVMEIHSRSGHGFKDAIRLSNCTGEIDSDYRGEVMVSLRYDGDPCFIVPKPRKGDRIAQAKLVEVPRVEFEEVDELSATVRGAGGFGSTGA